MKILDSITVIDNIRRYIAKDEVRNWRLGEIIEDIERLEDLQVSWNLDQPELNISYYMA